MLFTLFWISGSSSVWLESNSGISLWWNEYLSTKSSSHPPTTSVTAIRTCGDWSNNRWARCDITWSMGLWLPNCKTSPIVKIHCVRTFACWWLMLCRSGLISVSDCIWKCSGIERATKHVHLQLSRRTSGNGSTIVRCRIFIRSSRYGASFFFVDWVIFTSKHTRFNRISSEVSTSSWFPSRWTTVGMRYGNAASGCGTASKKSVTISIAISLHLSTPSAKHFNSGLSKLSKTHCNISKSRAGFLPRVSLRIVSSALFLVVRLFSPRQFIWRANAWQISAASEFLTSTFSAILLVTTPRS